MPAPEAQVYNENLRDLLAPSDNVLDLREDPVKGMVVAGVSEVPSVRFALLRVFEGRHC